MTPTYRLISQADERTCEACRQNNGRRLDGRATYLQTDLKLITAACTSADGCRCVVEATK